MELIPPKTSLKVSKTNRLIPTRYPEKGILDEITTKEELSLIWDLESWTNDRLNDQFGVLHLIPEDEWVLGEKWATIVMAAYCHPSPKGGRFNTPDLGAWYAAFELEAAIEETSYHRHKEFTEVGRLDGYTTMRQYLADFDSEFHDIRDDFLTYQELYDPESYRSSQEFSEFLRKIGSKGLLYNSVRSPENYCLVSFKPKLVKNVTRGAAFDYFWDHQGVFRYEEIRSPKAS